MTAGELMPCKGLVSAEMTLAYNQSAAFANSGQALIADFGPPKWRLVVRTARLTRDEAREWSAWFRRRDFRKVSFTAWRLMRRNPAGTASFSDESLTVSVDIANSQITITGDTTYQAREGDMISYGTAAGGYYLGEVVADASATGSSTVLTVRPQPEAPASTPNVRRRQALGEFRLVNPPEPFEDYANRAIQFEARQITR